MLALSGVYIFLVILSQTYDSVQIGSEMWSLSAFIFHAKLHLEKMILK